MDEYSRVVHVAPGGLLIVPDADGICGNSKILQPRLDQCPGGVSEMHLLSTQKKWQCRMSVSQSMQKTRHAHLHFKEHDEKQVGLCCKNVTTLSPLGMYKLYDEVDTGSCGQKPVTSKVVLHVGLQDWTIGITKICQIPAATNTPPPSRCGLQRNADRVAAITAQATMDNLKQKREQIKEINILRGLPENAPINISMDVRYNSTTAKNSYGAGQAAS